MANVEGNINNDETMTSGKPSPLMTLLVGTKEEIDVENGDNNA